MRVSSRDTCIWETPISAAICDWVMFLKKRSSRIGFSRGGRLSSSGLTDSRISTCASASSSIPIASSMLWPPSSESSVASRDRVA